MAISDRIKELRQQNGYSQEYLAEQLNVSRQAVSKWESGRVYPDIENIIALSELFNVTTDHLLKSDIYYQHNTTDSSDNTESKTTDENTKTVVININREFFKEYKSKRKLFGLPLIHINIGFGRKRVAKGIIAIGNISVGVISVGLISAGALSLGLISAGLLAFGVVAAGGFALGTVAIGLIALGAIAIGIVSGGAVAIGTYATGAVAIASKVAIGHHAEGYVAIGKTVEGVKTLIDYGSGNSFPSGVLKRAEVQQLITDAYPNISKAVLNWLSILFS